MLSAAELTHQFHQKIPISQALGLRIVEVSADHARLVAPLAPNINHVQTAFGGSLYATAALSCYALFQALSHAAGGFSDELVIQQGHIDYLVPVKGDFEVVARSRTPDLVQRFTESLRRHGKARLELEAEIREQDRSELAARFNGIYVYRGAQIGPPPGGR